MEVVLISTRDMLDQFIVSLPGPEQIYMVQKAILPFLKNLNIINVHFAAKAISNAGDQEEEDEGDTITNGEVPGNDEHSEGNTPDGNNEENPILNPRNLLISSKSQDWRKELPNQEAEN